MKLVVGIHKIKTGFTKIMTILYYYQVRTVNLGLYYWGTVACIDFNIDLAILTKDIKTDKNKVKL